jgi:hypothetical protein
MPEFGATTEENILGTSASERQAPLRVGVALDAPVVPAWISGTLSGLYKADFLDIRLVALDVGSLESPRSRASGSPALLFTLYEKLDYRLFKSAPDAFAHVEVIEDLRRPNVLTDLTDDSTLAAVRSEELDVVLWFASTRPRAELLDCARFGVWAVNHDESRTYPSDPSFARQLLDDQAVAATALQILGDKDDSDRVIYRSFSAIDPHSLYRSRNAAYWKAAHFMLRRLEHLHKGGWDFIRDLPTYKEPAARDRDIRQPSNAEMLRFLVRLVARALRSRLRKILYRETWFLAYRYGGGTSSADDLRDYVSVFPPHGHYFADPFVTRHDDRHYVLFEDYLTVEDRGVISYLELDATEHGLVPQVALTRDFHLSYPFTFALDGQLFMVPETAAKRTVELYRAEEFPSRWTFEATLLKGVEGVDATIVAHAGKLWLFVNVKEHGAHYSDELCIFFADALSGPWTSHWLNPVLSDVRSARPAGRIFERDGMLIRPGQDSSTGYGRAVVLNRIDVLSEDDYRESPIARIDHSWCRENLGTHTYNFDDGYEVVDGRRWERRWHPLEALLSRRPIRGRDNATKVGERAIR